jgi:transposase
MILNIPVSLSYTMRRVNCPRCGVKVIAQVLPRALNVLDRFHIAKKLGEAVDQVRREETKELHAGGYEPVLGIIPLVGQALLSTIAGILLAVGADGALHVIERKSAG